MKHLKILKLIAGSILLSLLVITYQNKVDMNEEVLKLNLHLSGFVVYAKFSIDEKVSKYFSNNIKISDNV